MSTDNEHAVILYVDDETHNLSSFKASFRRTYEVHLANSADKAFEILKTTDPQIIISDQRMPGMSGIEFFEKVKDLYPNPVRILLTAYTNSQTVIDAVNKGRIDRYLVKPWNSDIMTTTLQAGVSMHKARVELHKKNEELRKTNAELNRFVYSVSHDLRAPLMSILGLINLAKVDESDEGRIQYFELMEKSVDKMDNYIQTTLEYYRNFRSEVKAESLNVKKLIEEQIETLQSTNPNVTFNFSFEGEPEFLTDQMRLTICCANLISNAVKYGDKGDGKYTVDLDAKNTGSGFTLKVSDYGVGIAKSEQPYIFDMFYRSPKATHKKSTGLGLYLVKEAVSRIGGSIDVSSTPGEKTSFTLRLPISE